MEAAVEAAEARLKKERWQGVMKEVQERGSNRQQPPQPRRPWKDDSHITAGELRRQMKRMGLLKDADALHGHLDLPLPTLQPEVEMKVDPATVPLPDSGRTDRDEVAERAVDAATVPLPQSAETEQTAQADTAVAPTQEAEQQVPLPAVSEPIAAVDPWDVPLPESARSSTSTQAEAAAPAETETQPVQAARAGKAGRATAADTGVEHRTAGNRRWSD